MTKIKKFFKCTMALAIVMAMTMSTTALAADDVGAIEPRGVFIRTCIGFDPDYTYEDDFHTLIGSLVWDNTDGLSPVTVTYQYEQSGSLEASIGAYLNGSAEFEYVLASMRAEAGVSVTATRTWTAGFTASGSYQVPAGVRQDLDVYIPAVVTAGRLNYEVYMDGYPENVFYEYKTLTESFAPKPNSVSFKMTSEYRA